MIPRADKCGWRQCTKAVTQYIHAYSLSREFRGDVCDAHATEIINAINPVTVSRAFVQKIRAEVSTKKKAAIKRSKKKAKSNG